MKKRSKEIGKQVLAELDWFDEGFSITGRSAAVVVEQRRLKEEPFIAYVKVSESLDYETWTERIYLICRNEMPINFDPQNEIASFANRNAPVGRIASIDPRDEIDIVLPISRKTKTLRVIEKDIFVPKKLGVWDARNNQISFGFDEDFIRSLRETIALKPAQIEAKPTDGAKTLEELQRLEDERAKFEETHNDRKLGRMREIVESIALKDQPILDRSQDEFCRRPLKSQLILAGSPGTGKTTSIIKRTAMKSDPAHLRETDGISLGADRTSNWLMFTPNDLLKIYLKEAMNKEGLKATDQFVTTWERERAILSRDVLRFMKVGDKGLFSKTSQSLLIDNSSPAAVKTAKAFFSFLETEIFDDFEDACTILSDHRLDPSFITKATYPIAERFRSLVSQVKNIESRVRDLPSNDGDFRSIALIEQLSLVASEYTELRRNTENLITQFVDNWISSNPTLFNDIVEYLESSASAELPRTEEPEDDSELDLLELAEEEARSDEDPRLKARSRIRQAVRNHSEAIISKKQLRDKDQLFIVDYLQIVPSNEPDLILFAHLSLALKLRVLRLSSFNAFLRELPRAYQRFRVADIQSGQCVHFPEEVRELLKERRISSVEIDILIYSMLTLASAISRRTGFDEDSQRDVLRRIFDQYRTQISVDEATDFSALQLASIYYLTDPEFRSVTFSGDLMQRVTTVGLTSWKELTDLIPSIEQFDLIASYRQTPTLLKVAKKLYKHIIGDEPPFNSKHADKGSFPAPLKYIGSSDYTLASWIAARIHEIYKINGESLPSIAVFVPSEEDIVSTHKLLSEALNDYSIDVEPCMMGKVLGSGSNVRIFSIEYIKGLEFEGVFYIGIDRAYENHPALVDKYLYVGLTRATTFLGVTYSAAFPNAIGFLDEDFLVGDWSSFL